MSALPPKTQRELECILPRDLATLAHEYMMPPLEFGNQTMNVGQSGHWELIMIYTKKVYHRWYTNLWEDIMCGACSIGYDQIVDLAISNGAHNWLGGFGFACEKNRQDMMEKMYNNGIYVKLICHDCGKSIESHYVKNKAAIN
jgi:hypothetical protein